MERCPVHGTEITTGGCVTCRTGAAPQIYAGGVTTTLLRFPPMPMPLPQVLALCAPNAAHIQEGWQVVGDSLARHIELLEERIRVLESKERDR